MKRRKTRPIFPNGPDMGLDMVKLWSNNRYPGPDVGPILGLIELNLALIDLIFGRFSGPVLEMGLGFGLECSQKVS